MISQTLVDIYKKLFIPRTDFYWVYRNNSPFVNKYNGSNIPLEDKEIVKLLESNNTIGISLFIDDMNVLYGAIDIDAHIGNKDDMKTILHKQLIAKKRMIKYGEYLETNKYTFLINSSGSNNGWHVRVYPPKPINAIIMREFLAEIQIKLFNEMVDEIFPKQEKLSKDTPYGNQLKTPLSLHQKHNKIATIYDWKNKRLMGMKKSIDYMLDFNDTIEKAKPIFVDLSKRVFKKYIPINDKDCVTPPYCAVIEEYAIKTEFPSGLYVRHHYIDPNVAVYVKSHPNIQYPYLQAQSKTISCLVNWSKKLNTFRCWQIQAFLNHYNKDPIMKKCLKLCSECPYNNLEVTTQILNSSNTLSNNNDRNNGKS